METEEKTKEEQLQTKEEQLQKTLEDTKEALKKGFSQEEIDKLKTQGIKNKVEEFGKKVEDTLNVLEDTETVLTSPVYVGMLGRYSHGKTALVNALLELQPPKQLPEGPGIVTSMVTRIECTDDEDITYPIAYEIDDKDKTRRTLQLEELIACVGNTTMDTSGINYYKLDLPISGREMAKKLHEKNIHLIDMPGLGGKYFKDTNTTLQYVTKLDMIIAVIKIDEIKEAAYHIKDLIAGTEAPVIPVLTFSDRWKECDEYRQCKDDDAMKAKAKELIKEHIPALGPYLTNLIAVSALTGDNINELRKLIRNKVENTPIAIKRSRKEPSEIIRRRERILKEKFGSLKSNLRQLVDNLDKMTKPIIPQENELSSLLDNEHLKRESEYLANNVTKIIDRAEKDFKSQCVSLRYKQTYDELRKNIEQLEDHTKHRFSEEKIQDLNEKFENFKKIVHEETEKYIDEKTLTDTKKDALKRNVRTNLSTLNFEDRLQDIIQIEFDELKIDDEYSSYKAKIAVKAIIQTLMREPLTLIMFILGLVLIWFLPVGTAIGAVLLFIVFIKVAYRFPKVKNESFKELRDNIINLVYSFFDTNKIKKDLKEAISEWNNDILRQIDYAINDDASKYIDDGRRLDKLQQNIKCNIENLLHQISTNGY